MAVEAVVAGSRSRPAIDEVKAVDTAWKIHAAIVDWTGKVDTKASFTLALESAAIAAIVSLSANGRRLSDLTGWPSAIFWIGLGLVLLGALLSASVVAPRLRSTATKNEWPENFVYFGHLRHWDPEELANKLKEADILPVLSRQLVNMSRVSWTKHRRVQVSLIFGISGAALVFIAGVIR
jgi:Family of unknown function (DUF5706)